MSSATGKETPQIPVAIIGGMDAGKTAFIAGLYHSRAMRDDVSARVESNDESSRGLLERIERIINNGGWPTGDDASGGKGEVLLRVTYQGSVYQIYFSDFRGEQITRGSGKYEPKYIEETIMGGNHKPTMVMFLVNPDKDLRDDKGWSGFLTEFQGWCEKVDLKSCERIALVVTACDRIQKEGDLLENREVIDNRIKELGNVLGGKKNKGKIWDLFYVTITGKLDEQDKPHFAAIKEFNGDNSPWRPLLYLLDYQTKMLKRKENRAYQLYQKIKKKIKEFWYVMPVVLGVAGIFYAGRCWYMKNTIDQIAEEVEMYKSPNEGTRLSQLQSHEAFLSAHLKELISFEPKWIGIPLQGYSFWTATTNSWSCELEQLRVKVLAEQILFVRENAGGKDTDIWDEVKRIEIAIDNLREGNQKTELRRELEANKPEIQIKRFRAMFGKIADLESALKTHAEIREWKPVDEKSNESRLQLLTDTEKAVVKQACMETAQLETKAKETDSLDKFFLIERKLEKWQPESPFGIAERPKLFAQIANSKVRSNAEFLIASVGGIKFDEDKQLETIHKKFKDASGKFKWRLNLQGVDDVAPPLLRRLSDARLLMCTRYAEAVGKLTWGVLEGDAGASPKESGKWAGIDKTWTAAEFSDLTPKEITCVTNKLTDMRQASVRRWDANELEYSKVIETRMQKTKDLTDAVDIYNDAYSNHRYNSYLFGQDSEIRNRLISKVEKALHDYIDYYKNAYAQDVAQNVGGYPRYEDMLGEFTKFRALCLAIPELDRSPLEGTKIYEFSVKCNRLTVAGFDKAFPMSIRIDKVETCISDVVRADNFHSSLELRPFSQKSNAWINIPGEKIEIDFPKTNFNNVKEFPMPQNKPRLALSLGYRKSFLLRNYITDFVGKNSVLSHDFVITPKSFTNGVAEVKWQLHNKKWTKDVRCDITVRLHGSVVGQDCIDLWNNCFGKED